MQHQPLLLAIDLGTSGPKLAVFTVEGKLLASVVKKKELIYPQKDSERIEGAVEQSPKQWWHSICEGLDELLASPNFNRKDIKAMACTSQWSGTVAVDSKAKALMNAIIWMDSRGAPYIEELISGPLSVEGYSVSKLASWIRRTGGAPGKSGKDPLAHILLIKDKYPEVYQRTYKFLEPKDYLNLLFCGRFASSYDAITLHWITNNRNLSKVTYDQKLLKLCGLERRHFPELLPACSLLGPILPSIAKRFGLAKDCQIAVSSPDLQSAAVGSGAVEDYQAHLYIGSSSWISCHTPTKKTDLFTNMATLPSSLPGRYFVANEQESAGICLDYLKNNLLNLNRLKDDDKSDSASSVSFTDLNTWAKKSPAGSHKLIFTPWLNGERSPVDNHTVRGGFHNLSLNHQSEDFIRAVFEGVAYNSKWLLGCVEKFVKRKLDSIHMIGGGAKSDLWCQIHADVMQRTIKQVDHAQHANARGAAWIAAIAMGYINSEDIPALISFKKIFTPNSLNNSCYQRQFNEFLNIYHANKKLYKSLNDYKKS